MDIEKAEVSNSGVQLGQIRNHYDIIIGNDHSAEVKLFTQYPFSNKFVNHSG